MVACSKRFDARVGVRMEQEKGKGRDTDDNLLDFCVGETILPKLIPAGLGF